MAHVGQEFAFGLVRRPRGVLRLEPIGDVDENFEELLPPPDPDDPDRLEDGHLLSVRAHQDALLVIHRQAKIQHRAASLVGLAHERVASAAHDLLRGQPEQSRRGGVRALDDVCSGIQDQDPRGQILEQRPLELLPLAPGLVRHGLLRDVPDDAVEA